MFNNQIILTVNKRLKSAEDRQILANLKEDIFNLNTDVKNIFNDKIIKEKGYSYWSL